MNDTSNPRQVLALLKALINPDRDKGTRDWMALAPANPVEAEELFRTAIEVLTAITADPRLGGQQQYVDRMLDMYVKLEASGR